MERDGRCKEGGCFCLLKERQNPKKQAEREREMGGVGVTRCPRTGAHGYGQGVCSCPQVCRAGRVPVAGVTCEDTQGAAAVQGCGKTLEHRGELDRSMCLCTRVWQEGFSTERCTEKEQLAADVGKGPFLLFGTTTQGGAARWLPPTMYPGPRASSDAVLSAPSSATTKSRLATSLVSLVPSSWHASPSDGHFQTQPTRHVTLLQ